MALSQLRILQQDYSYSDNSSTTTTGRRIDAQAMAAQNQIYDPSGTDIRFSPSDLDPDEVLGYVNHNINLRRGINETYAIFEGGELLYTWNRYNPNGRRLEGIGYSWGGYIKRPTDAQIQKELDEYRAD